MIAQSVFRDRILSNWHSPHEQSLPGSDHGSAVCAQDSAVISDPLSYRLDTMPGSMTVRTPVNVPLPAEGARIARLKFRVAPYNGVGMTIVNLVVDRGEGSHPSRRRLHGLMIRETRVP